MTTKASTGFSAKAFSKYLGRYAEPEAREIGVRYAETLRQPYSVALVVPAFAESPDFLHGLLPALKNTPGRALCVVVVNAPRAAMGDELRATRGTLSGLKGSSAENIGTEPPVWLVRDEAFDLLLIACLGDHAISVKQGVGLARKIGTDMAAALFSAGGIESPWIYQTDADVVLPTAHLLHAPQAGSVALSLPFLHVAGGDAAEADAAIYAATLQYETALRYQVLGLAWAGSRYAWHAVGSSLAVHVKAYCSAHGFPKRAAGEDFHLLQKLAKLGSLEVPDSEPLEIVARRSERVPFGTGPAIERLLMGGAWNVDSPESLVVLRGWHAWLEQADADSSVDEFLAGLPPDLRAVWQVFLADVGFDEWIKDARRHEVFGERFHRRALNWFDGLKCRQLLNRLQECWPRLPLLVALSQAPFVSCAATDVRAGRDWDALRRVLFEAERSLPSIRGPVVA